YRDLLSWDREREFSSGRCRGHRRPCPGPPLAGDSSIGLAGGTRSPGGGLRTVVIGQPAGTTGGAMARIKVNVDGVQYIHEIKPRTLLVEYLRENLCKVGTVIGCDTAHCGACTVLVGGGVSHEGMRAVKSCVMLAVQVDGGS